MRHMKVQMWDRRRLGFYEVMPRHYCVKMSVCCDSSQESGAGGHAAAEWVVMAGCRHGDTGAQEAEIGGGVRT